ncbi:MAG: 4'-phosphopantetheinyl transferase family protein, partial [Stellaceae bacterium]
RAVPDALNLVNRFFAPREAHAFQRLAEAERSPAFLRAWTRKEAVLKAMGTGISGDLSSVEVLTDTVVSTSDASTTWSVRTLSMPQGFHGAVANEGEALRVVTWQAVAPEGLGG